MADVCGYTVVDYGGFEGPCDRPATGWRWYQDVEHEDTLDPACGVHSNEGGRRIHALERVTDVLSAWERQPCHMTGEAAAEILRRVMEEAKTDG